MTEPTGAPVQGAGVDLAAGGSPRGGAWYLVRLCFVASLGGFLFGFDTAVISGTVSMIERQFALSKILVGWFGSSALLGCIPGAALAGWLSDRYGRKPSLIAASVLLFISALYSMIPPSFTVLTWARALGGIGVGMASVIAPTYISEFAPPRLRGRLVALFQLSIVLGILVAYLSNWLLSQYRAGCPEAVADPGFFQWITINEAWRSMFGMETVPAAAFFLLLFIIPESPRWLVKAGRDEQAMRILTAVEGPAARAEMAAIRGSLAQETGSIRELFQPGLRLALIVGVGLSFFGQLTGVNIVVYYGETILKGSGLATSFQWMVVLGLVNFAGTVIAVWKIDSWGRRPLLIGGMAAVTVALGLVGLFMLIQAPPVLVALLICAYMGFLAVSICGVIWVLTPEIFPNRLRGRAASIATFVNWSTNMLTALAFPWYEDTFGTHTAMFTLAGVCAVATYFFFKLVPETKGRSLEEITRQLSGGRP